MHDTIEGTLVDELGVDEVIGPKARTPRPAFLLDGARDALQAMPHAVAPVDVAAGQR